MAAADPAAPVPQRVVVRRRSRLLELDYGEGRSYRLPFEFLRVYSPSAEVRGHGPFPYQVDGDHLGDIEEISIRYVPDVLDLVVPVRPLDPAET